jgi:hypothetical protein
MNMAIFKREQVTCEVKQEQLKLAPKNKCVLKQNLRDGSFINTAREADCVTFLTQRFLLQMLS